MADVKISGLPASTTPLAGTEVLPVVQSGVTKQVSIANVTAGRAVAALSVTTNTYRAASSSGGALQNSGGTPQLQWGAGGGNNLSVDVAININPANAAVAISPTGTGTVTINPATASTMNNVAIGGTTPLAGNFTTLQNVNLFTNYQTATIGGTAGDKLDFERDVAIVGGTAQQLYTILYRHTTGSNFLGTGYRLQNRADTTDAAYIGWGSPTEWNDVGMYNSTGNGVRISTAGNAIVNTGNLVIGTSGKGIDFSATPGTGTSELLADYEEGTWTPNQGAGLTVVGAFSSSGTYTKVGRLVTINGFVAGATSVAVSGAGVITNNLPFNAASEYTGVSVNNAISASAGSIVSVNFLYSSASIAATPKIFFSVTYTV